jgi:hypothetical protein
MLRTIEIVVPPDETDRLVAELSRAEDLLGLRVQRNVSLQPSGDVIAIDTTTESLHTIMRFLVNRGLGREARITVTTTEPMSIVSATMPRRMGQKTSQATWEEMEHVIARESKLTVNAMLLMAIAGIFAAVGIATNALHIVMGGMVIAPAFRPLMRVSLGAVTESPAWRRGAAHTVQGYLALAAGAATTALFLMATGTPPPRRGGHVSSGRGSCLILDHHQPILSHCQCQRERWGHPAGAHESYRADCWYPDSPGADPLADNRQHGASCWRF